MGTMESWESTRSFYREKHTLRSMEGHVEPFRRAFSEIDVNDDGVITKVDLQTFVRKNRLVEDEMIEVVILVEFAFFDLFGHF
ncbi:unnamed protein product [Dibothriocephalus latus]|uniref:EF-hand domain-containing protein n=1 Tax=Dibothriocephalus latus TaxID=60516 RepID=A0A3P6USZ4_DIBLA|nr:unnamed protein product [Dibothriocephalus latus]